MPASFIQSLAKVARLLNCFAVLVGWCTEPPVVVSRDQSAASSASARSLDISSHRSAEGGLRANRGYFRRIARWEQKQQGRQDFAHRKLLSRAGAVVRSFIIEVTKGAF
jgi:hypothetical protein